MRGIVISDLNEHVFTVYRRPDVKPEDGQHACQQSHELH